MSYILLCIIVVYVFLILVSYSNYLKNHINIIYILYNDTTIIINESAI